MNRAYFDVSYLAKLHWNEWGSAEVLKLAGNFTTLFCAAHGRVEFAAVGHRKMREKSANLHQAKSAFAQLEDAIRANALRWVPLEELVFDRVQRFYLTDPGVSFLRASDALHLACAAEHGFTEIHSNDRHLLAAAPIFGLRGVDVIPKL